MSGQSEEIRRSRAAPPPRPVDPRKKQPDDWSPFNTLSLLGSSCWRPEEVCRGRAAYPPGLRGAEGPGGQDPRAGKSNLAEAAERIVRLYEAWGKPDKAAEWRKRLGMPDAGLPNNVFER